MVITVNVGAIDNLIPQKVIASGLFAVANASACTGVNLSFIGKISPNQDVPLP